MRWIPIVKFPNAQVLGGNWAENTPALAGIIKQIIVKAPSSNTQFDFSIVDDLDLKTFSREVTTDGELNELIELPVTGIYTLKIENSNKDELFKIKMMEVR